MKKIAIILPGKYPLPPVNGGAVENLVHTLVLNNEADPHFYFDIYSKYDFNAKTLSKKFKFTNYIYIPTDGLIYKIKRLLRWLVNHTMNKYTGNQFIHSVIKNICCNYDYILLENAPWYVLPLKKKIGAKIILHLHNDYLNAESRINSLIVNQLDSIFTVSNYVRNVILHWTTDAACKTKVLYNGISLERFKNVSENVAQEIRNQFGIRQNDFVFVFSGRLVPGKGVLELLLAMNEINNPSIKLLIIGASNFAHSKDTRFTEEIKKISESNKNIIFTGYVDYEQIHNYYSVGNVAIVPSVWEEACPLSCLEFMASGLPLIVTNSGGMIEEVTNECAIIVKKEERLQEQLLESMKYLYSNSEICTRMGLASLKRSLLFSDMVYWRNFVQLMNAI